MLTQSLSQHSAVRLAWRPVLWRRNTVLKSVNLCDVSAAQLILKVQLQMRCKGITSLSGFVNSLNLEKLYVAANELWQNITSRCFELQSLDKLWLLLSFEICYWGWSSKLSCKILRRYDQLFSRKWRLKLLFLVVFRTEIVTSVLDYGRPDVTL